MTTKPSLNMLADAKEKVFRTNTQTVDVDITVAATENAIAAGPVTIQSGSTVTVDLGGNLVIVGGD